MTTACVHHYVVSGCGIVQRGRCIFCEAEREFRPFPELRRFVHGRKAPKPDETEEKTT